MVASYRDEFEADLAEPSSQFASLLTQSSIKRCYILRYAAALARITKLSLMMKMPYFHFQLPADNTELKIFLSVATSLSLVQYRYPPKANIPLNYWNTKMQVCSWIARNYWTKHGKPQSPSGFQKLISLMQNNRQLAQTFLPAIHW